MSARRRFRFPLRHTSLHVEQNLAPRATFTVGTDPSPRALRVKRGAASQIIASCFANDPAFVAAVQLVAHAADATGGDPFLRKDPLCSVCRSEDLVPRHAKLVASVPMTAQSAHNACKN